MVRDRYGLLIATVLLLAVPAAEAQRAGKGAAALPENCKAFVHKTMPYRLLVPKGYDPAGKYPLVLCFHGAGGRGSTNLAQGTEAATVLMRDQVQAQHPCFVLVPQCASGKQWVDTPWGKGSYALDKVPISEEMTLALEILDKVRAEYSVDPDRIYVSGQSMGGFASWDVLMRRPDTFAAAIINCGGGDPTQAGRLKHVPIWNFHGDKDSTVPTRGSREMVEALKKVGGNIQYTEQPGLSHISWTKAWQTPGLVDWLFAQKRGAPASPGTPTAPAATTPPKTPPR